MLRTILELILHVAAEVQLFHFCECLSYVLRDRSQVCAPALSSNDSDVHFTLTNVTLGPKAQHFCHVLRKDTHDAHGHLSVEVAGQFLFIEQKTAI